MNLAVDLLTGGRDVMTSAQAKVIKIHLKHCVQKLAEAEMNLTRIARAATGIGNIFVLYSKLYFRRHEWMQAGHRGFIEYRPPKINSEYWPNIDHTALYRPNFDHKSSLKSAHVFTRFATKVRMFIRAGLYPTSQEIQGAGRYFHMTSFNGRVHFEVLRFVIFQIIGKIYHHSEIFWWYIDHFNAISTKNSRISTI